MTTASTEPVSGTFAVGRNEIGLHLRDLRQLFDALDPSPFREKDLDRNAEEYIVDTVKEMPSRTPRAIVIHLDQPAVRAGEGRTVEDAVRVHFARRAGVLRRDLHRLIRRGVVSLAIGIAFLASVFALSQVVAGLAEDGPGGRLFREGLLIVGWVAMWRPLEIFLYDWWPILGEVRVHDRLSRVAVRIIPGGTPAPDSLTRLLAPPPTPTDAKAPPIPDPV